MNNLRVFVCGYTANYDKLTECDFPFPARIEEKGIKPLLDILETLGGWPVLKGDDWNTDSSWTWVKSVKDFRTQGYSTDYFFDFSVGTDLKNSTRRIIDVRTSFFSDGN